MLQIILHYLVAYYACASHPVTYRPEALALVTPEKTREFLLKMMECSTFKFFQQQTYALVRRILYMHVHMVLAYYSFQKYGHPHCCISGSAIHGNVSGYRPATLHTDTSSLILGDISNCLRYEHYDNSLPCHKDNNLYRNLSRRNEWRGFNPLFG